MQATNEYLDILMNVHADNMNIISNRMTMFVNSEIPAELLNGSTDCLRYRIILTMVARHLLKENIRLKQKVPKLPPLIYYIAALSFLSEDLLGRHVSKVWLCQGATYVVSHLTTLGGFEEWLALRPLDGTAN